MAKVTNGRKLVWRHKVSFDISACFHLGRVAPPKRMNFPQRGGGAFSIQKFLLQILETLVYFTFTLVFEHEIDKKKNNFRVQGMFFSTIVMILTDIN